MKERGEEREIEAGKGEKGEKGESQGASSETCGYVRGQIPN